MPGAVPDTGLPVGTILTYNASIQSSVWSSFKTGLWTPESVFQQLGVALGGWGLGIVSSDSAGISATISGDVPIVLKLQMQGPQTYGQPNDVKSIVDGAIINIMGGNYIDDSNISDWTIPKSAGGTGETVDTGAPGNDTSVFGQLGLGSISDALGKAVGDATKNLGVGSGLLIFFVILAGLAAVIVIVAPTSPGAVAAGFAHPRRRS